MYSETQARHIPGDGLIAYPPPVKPPFEERHALTEARARARAWIATVPQHARHDLAAEFSRRAFLQMAELKAPGIKVSEPFVSSSSRLSAAPTSLAQRIGCGAAALPMLEAAHFISSLYSVLLDTSERSRLGAFYTPPALVNRLLELAEGAGLDWSNARVLDPACGGGAFILQAADRMRAALSTADPTDSLARLGERLTGFEIDPHAAWLCQASLDLLLNDLASRGKRPVPRMVRVCDALDVPATPSFDLVAGNPPYGRVTLAPDRRRRFSRGLYGHANLYGLFTDLATRWAKPDSLIAFLTPTSFLGGQYFRALRNLIAMEAPPIAIDFVCSRRGVFEDALQETLLALYRKGGERLPIRVHYLQVAGERDARAQENGTVVLPEDPSCPWLAPRSPSQSKIAAAAAKMPSRLSDWGYCVSTGPLVWNRFKEQLRQQLSKSTYPLIWAEAVTTEGRFVYRAEKRNHAPFFYAGPSDEWMLVRKPAVLVQRTTAKEQARRLVAAELPIALLRKHGAVVVENHLNMIQACGEPKVSPRALASVLNSTIVDQVFRCISGSVAVSAVELLAIPLPPAEEMRLIEQLVKTGASKAIIEAELERLYGAASA